VGKTGFWQQALRPALIWGFIFAVTATAFGLIFIGPQNVWQMVLPHLAASEVDYYQQQVFDISSHIRGNWTNLLLALMGTLIVLKKKRWLSLYPIGWMILGYIFVAQNTPIRYHHLLIYNIPAAMLAGVAIGEVAGMIPDLIKSRNLLNKKTMVSAIVLIALALIIMERIPRITQHRNSIRTLTETSPQIRIMQKMYKFAPQTSWIVTDRPMYAFRIGLPVPPPIAVITRKRLVTGNLTEEQFIDAVKIWQPEQVLLGRFDFPSLENYLEEDYRLIHSRLDIKLYVRKDM
jgi:hypothetical protein